jgi:hypothetical protein
MRTRIEKIVAGLLLLATPIFAAPLFAQPGESVVRIKTEHGVGTGFAWSRPRYIVTALHVVAGAQSISVYSEAKKESSKATIVTALHAPDLALLRLERDLGLTPLTHAGVDSNDTSAHFVWGYPHDVAEMTRHQVQIVGGLNSAPTLSSIFKNDSQLKQTVGAQGYPQLDSRIVRVEKIQPGHSGAPLVNKAGQVVGIGDGGLRDGLGGLNWAIPASVYLPALPDSRDPIPSRSSVQKTLFSTPSDSAQPMQMGNEGKLYQVWRATVPELLEVLGEELRGHVSNLIVEAQEVGNADISNTVVDIYEDEISGATFAAPQGAGLHYDPDLRRMTVVTASGLEMLVQIGRANDWQTAMDTLEGFADELLNSREDWQADPDFADIQTEDEQEQLAEWLFNRVAVPSDDSDGRYSAFLEANLLADRQNYLGTAVIAHDSDLFGEQQWQEFYQLVLSVMLADFASY